MGQAQEAVKLLKQVRDPEEEAHMILQAVTQTREMTELRVLIAELQTLVIQVVAVVEEPQCQAEAVQAGQ
jgi:hypothetical protein